MLKQFVAGVAIAVMLTGVAIAGPFEDADDAYRRGDYATALRLWQALAEQGDARAEFNLGLMSGIGEGGSPQDLPEAAKWFQIAADQGHAEAQYNLGLAYHNGTGVPRDYGQAVRWYRLAANQGYAMAQFNLGLMYAKGEGVPPDLVVAHVWFHLSAAGGIAGGQANRDMVASLITPEQIAEAERWAQQWKPVAERCRSSTACTTRRAP